MSEPPGRSGTYLQVGLGALALAGLSLTSRYNLLLFNCIAGCFSVVIAVGVFAVAWNVRGFRENNYLLFLGIAYLFVGALDLLYILAYKGMGVFPGGGIYLSCQLWWAARCLESMSLCLAPLCLGRRLKPYAVLGGYLLIFVAIILIILVWRVFPVSGVAGPGVTALKQTGDYVASVFLLGAMVLLWRRREEFDPGVLRRLLGAMALAVASEAALTWLAAVSALGDLLGRLLKMLSLYLIYQALIATELRKPYQLLFRAVRRNEALVRQERDLAHGLMETAPVMALVLDAQGRILRLNHAGEQLMGYALAQVQGRPFWEIFPAPEEVEAVQEAFHHLLDGDSPQAYESNWVAQDGSRRLIAWSNTALSAEDGAVTQVIGAGLDVTHRREAEYRLQQLKTALESQIGEVQARTRQLAVIKGELETVTDLIFHHLQVPLRWVSGFCRALQGNGAHRLDLKGRTYLKRLHEAIQPMEELIEALRRQVWTVTANMHRQEIDLSLQARAIAAALQSTAPTRRVEFIIGTGLTAEGDPAMLQVVLETLLGNAWKVTEEVPQGRIEFEALPGTNDCRGFLVRDNRAGANPSGEHRLFRACHRFHTTRDFSGPGLGLATVQRIIHRHGGRLWVDLATGQGATVYFTLPKAAGQQPVNRPLEPARKA